MSSAEHANLSLSNADPNLTTGVGPAAVGVPASVTARYTLGDEIDRGGMGIIYRATDTVLGREVAVKVLREKVSPNSGAALRFAGEARITGQLQHPSIPPVHDLGTLPDGRPFLAMKLIKGQTLAESLKARPNPSVERGRFVAVFEQICQALAYAHSHDVIHRDLKPANVMVGAFGEVQVMDWGLAKVLRAETPASPAEAANEATRAATQISPTPEAGSHTQAGSVLGTPAFAPPEQALGEIDKVDARSDVFGLGAILAVLLTGKPPYVGETAESVRVQAVRGKLDDCFARLAGCGAEPELVAVCRRCLAFEPADRPANAGEVAKAVAKLRAAADERARRAELERVRVEGEQATAEAQAAERRKRRRLWLGAAAALAVAVVGGLTAVLAVQRRANADLAAKNDELAEEQVKVQARFNMAVKAIETFHTGVSEDALLRNDQFKELRTKLLKAAAGFYADLERLLAGQTDAKSRKTLATGYFQLAELTWKIGDQTQALAAHRQALAVRREMAATPEADVVTRLDVIRSLGKVGVLLLQTGDTAAALRICEEARDLAERLETLEPTDAVRSELAQAHGRVGFVLGLTGKPAEGVEAIRKGLVIHQKLVDANPANTEFLTQLARSTRSSGSTLMNMGNPADALQAFRKELPLWQKLAAANPANTEFKSDLAECHLNIGLPLWTMGKLAEVLEPTREALAIYQKLVDDYPAVSLYQQPLGTVHSNIGVVLTNTGKPTEGLEAYRKALAIRQKLVENNPANTNFQHALAKSHESFGIALLWMGKPAEALEPLQKALLIRQKLVDASPAHTSFQERLANVHTAIGRAQDRQKRFAEAFTALEAGVTIRQKLAEAEPQNTSYSRDLGESHAFRGAARVRAGHPAEAAADLRRAIELWAKVQRLDIEMQAEQARARALLSGLGGDVKSGVTAAEAKTFADQAVAALADIVKLGWALPSELKEPDFDALRNRGDFQKLVAEVEAKAEKPAETARPGEKK